MHRNGVSHKVTERGECVVLAYIKQVKLPLRKHLDAKASRI